MTIFKNLPSCVSATNLRKKVWKINFYWNSSILRWKWTSLTQSIEIYTRCILHKSTFSYYSWNNKINWQRLWGVFLDISKVLDKIWHEGLIFKLKQNGVCGNLLNLLCNFLINRKQRALLNGLSLCLVWC